MIKEIKIIDKDGNIIVNPDLSLGRLVPDKLLVAHHPAQPEIQEQSHREEVARYANGGIDYIRVIDVPYAPAKAAWDEFEDIYRYILYTKEELEELNKPSPDEDRDSMLIDLDYRLTLLELGV